MAVSVNDFSFRSSSGLWDIHARSYEPNSPIGVFQITHGMAEHIDRYDDFARFLAGNGYAVFIHDDIGHGKSVKSDDMLGFFGEENGDKTLVEDVKLLTGIARTKYPDLPVILFGHSMGSFVARSYCSKYASSIDGAIICGTSGPNPGAKFGEIIANFIAKRKGSMYRSPFINSLAFGSYNNKIENKRTDFDWLTRDDAIVDKYIADKYCGFLFTAKGYRDMFRILQAVSADSWYDAVPKSLPMFFIAGDSDPVGSYGKGVKTVTTKLGATGHSKVECKLYPGCRHEILNELCRQDVYEDILAWVKKNS